MVELDELWHFCDALLEVGDYQDYCPNGLQVEGRHRVQRILCGVTASQALLDTAVEYGADLVLVHHGYFWKGEDPTIRGIRQRRLKTLLEHEISLLAYHLPLDGHPLLGNNAQLAQRWGMTVEGRFGPGPNGGIAMHGRLPEVLDATQLAHRISSNLNREALLIKGGKQTVQRIGWCSGAAQGYLEQAADLGLDAFISGEISEHTMHTACEMGIHYLAAGHHATERYGVTALGAHLAEHFGLEWRFAEIDNPA